jgi:NADH dehydrogenase FAD-containing subunit
LIDRRNYRLFQPLLYQVATASLSPADMHQSALAAPPGQHRGALRPVTGIDRRAKAVLLDDRRFTV